MNQHVHKRIKSIKFKLMSPKLIKKLSAAKVVTPELYDKEGYPVDGGLMDVRLGVIDPGLTCKTCGHKLKECPGHSGYIELARPVMHIEFVAMVYLLLRTTCGECGRIKATDADLSSQRRKLKKALKQRGVAEHATLVKEYLTKLRAIKKCPHCKAKQNDVTLEKPSRFLEKDKRVSPIEVRSRLERIPDSDLEIFGMNAEFMRPEWMILTVLPIPSVSMRPSITLESGERSEDDLTHKLGDIVRINQRLFENINAGVPEIVIEDLWDLLQYHVTTFFNNEVAQLPPARHRSGEPLKTLADRIKSKKGRIRQNLVGKRTNFSARTVISPDPMLRINDVGVPKQIAMKLTVPERATPWNIVYLKSLVKKGPKEYPGSNYVTRPDGKKKRITDETKEELLEELEPGYVVERHLIDGDIALFNRQPSLHKMSMMCHKVRVLDGKTFRLNVAVCFPYNADFDGDEMNLHIPQTEEARAEAEILMEVSTQLISPAYGLSVMGCVQDAVTGNYLLTREDTKMSRHEAVNLLYSVGIKDYSKLSNKETVTGKDIFSVLIPDDFNFTSQAEPVIVIKNGKLVSGEVDAKQLSAGSGLLLRSIHKKYGPKKTAEILTNLFKLGIKFLLKRGFTVGLSDIELSKVTYDDIDHTMDNAYDEVDKLIELHNNGELEILPGRSAAETLEKRIMGVLNQARDKAGSLAAKDITTLNPLIIMSRCGKGKLLNIAQMTACVGQQSMKGGRVREGYKDRTLSCFEKNDLRPKARGFIRHGFKQGLSPSEFFFGAMIGRESLMDTALRTPRSGYLYRRLSNSMQDLRVEYDGTVRDSASGIIQFNYGEDGIDVSKSEHGKINVQRIINRVNGNGE